MFLSSFCVCNKRHLRTVIESLATQHLLEDSNLHVGLTQETKRMHVPYAQNAGWSNPRFTHVVASLMTAKTFPCSVSSLRRYTLYHRPSYPSLRQGNNGDRHLEVGARSAPEKLGPTPWTHSPCTLPSFELQPGTTPAGKSLEGIEPSGWPGYHETGCCFWLIFCFVWDHK